MQLCVDARFHLHILNLHCYTVTVSKQIKFHSMMFTNCTSIVLGEYKELCFAGVEGFSTISDW